MLVTLLQAQLPPSNLTYLFAAFAVSWLVFFVYAFIMARRQQELERQVQALRESRPPPGNSPAG
ncbi:MAG: CcmD family protein [Dehalococcoidia bacterium]|nr:CcmD family protein [Dehalococcoidia bacterium]MSQ17830.1 CcmD family protein [Dehalococcoidia bacterium]